MKSLRSFILVLLAWFPAVCLAAPTQVLAPDPLKVAQELAASDYKGKKYADVDCTAFVTAVVEKILGQQSAATKRTINISSISKDQVTASYEANAPELAGVQKALTDLGKGEVIAPQDAKPGDFVQYWMKKSDGSVFGHAAVISRVWKSGSTYRAALFGSHQSTDGIADKDFDGVGLALNAVNRKVFIVRLK